MPLRSRYSNSYTSQSHRNSRSNGISSRKIGLILVFVILFLGIILLWRSGGWLVSENDPGKYQWALVLDGETRECERTDAAATLYSRGKVDNIILSGTRIFKSKYYSEFKIPLLVAEGVPRTRIFEFKHDGHSTIEEASLFIPQARLLGIDTLLIITSNFHTARSKMIYNKLAQGNPVIRMHPAKHPDYLPEAWWANRTSLKTHVLESVKWIQSFLEVNLVDSHQPKELQANNLQLEPREPLLRFSI